MTSILLSRCDLRARRLGRLPRLPIRPDRLPVALTVQADLSTDPASRRRFGCIRRSYQAPTSAPRQRQRQRQRLWTAAALQGSPRSPHAVCRTTTTRPMAPRSAPAMQTRSPPNSPSSNPSSTTSPSHTPRTSAPTPLSAPSSRACARR